MIINIIVDKKGDDLYKQEYENIVKFRDLNNEFYESVLITEKSSFSQLPSIFWFTTLFTLFCYGSYLPFNSIASGFLTENFFKDLNRKEAERNAGILMSIPFIIACISVPVLGYLIDIYGKRAYLTLISSILGIFGFISFLFIQPIFGFILIGFSYSLTSTVCWNIISIVVKNDSIVIKVNFSFYFYFILYIIIQRL